MNPMRRIKVDKVTVNIGVGSPGERLDNAKVLLERLTGQKAVITKAKRRNQAFKLRKGLEIGVKTTLRGKKAEEFLKKALASKKNKLNRRVIDKNGNFSFGIAEYIDFPGAKYDPEIGMLGFDVCVTLMRPGKRVETRMRRKSKIGQKHRISKQDTMEFLEKNFGVVFEG